MTKKAVYIIAVVALILIAGFLAINLNSLSSNQEGIEIGGLFHLTGAGAFWGEGEYNGATLAIEEINEAGGINGKSLKIIIEDGKTDFPETVNALKKLAQIDGVKIIIGPTWFGQVASPLAEELKVLVISPSAGVV